MPCVLLKGRQAGRLPEENLFLDETDRKKKKTEVMGTVHVTTVLYTVSCVTTGDCQLQKINPAVIWLAHFLFTIQCMRHGPFEPVF